MGCDVKFLIGDVEVWMNNTKLSSRLEASIENIVKELYKNEQIREELEDKLKYLSSVREVTLETLMEEGFVANATVGMLATKYPDLDWDDSFKSIKVFIADWIRYLDTDVHNCIITLFNPKTNLTEKIYVLDPDNIQEVRKLNEHLRVRKIINSNSDNNKIIYRNSKLDKILSELSKIDVSALKTKRESLLTRKRPASEETIIKLDKQIEELEEFANSNIKTIPDLLDFYLEHESFFAGKKYKDGDGMHSMRSELDRVIKALLGIDVTESQYADIFANEIVQLSKYNYHENNYRISKTDFIGALLTKLSNLEMEESEENLELIDALKKYLKNPNSSKAATKTIVDLLIDSIDDEFAYGFDYADGKYIYLKNVPKTLGERFGEEIPYNSIKFFKPRETYRGYTIYQDEKGKYYYSKHPISRASFGNRYTSIQDCKDKIDNRLKYNSISLESLIEFKFLSEDDEYGIVFIPNAFVPGLIIKSLKLPLKEVPLNPEELGLIYANLSRENNNLEKFWEYSISILNSDSVKVLDRYRRHLEKIIDSPEKASCFIYMLNLKAGPERVKRVDPKIFDEILEEIENAEKNQGYEYFRVDEVTQIGKGGRKLYTNITRNQRSYRTMYKVLYTRIDPADIKNSKRFDDKTGTPIASYELLKRLAEKMELKLKIKIHVESYADLKERFEGEFEVPEDARGFVKNGEIYINMSNASLKDLFHEYTHIMLGVLKAMNFDTYYELVNLVASKAPKSVVSLLKRKYPDLAQSDLNEEIFADLLGGFLAGNNMDKFLEGTLAAQVLAIDDGLLSIFSLKQPLSQKFYKSSLFDIFKLFSYDLNMQLKEDNGLSLKKSLTYREATNWIQDLIREYKKEGSEVGIYQECD